MVQVEPFSSYRNLHYNTNHDVISLFKNLIHCIFLKCVILFIYNMHVSKFTSSNKKKIKGYKQITTKLLWECCRHFNLRLLNFQFLMQTKTKAVLYEVEKLLLSCGLGIDASVCLGVLLMFQILYFRSRSFIEKRTERRQVVLACCSSR